MTKNNQEFIVQKLRIQYTEKEQEKSRLFAKSMPPLNKPRTGRLFFKIFATGKINNDSTC